MVHLITIVGKSAGNFYLEQDQISDFKAVIRGVTSGRVMLISTRFRSDLFYYQEAPANQAILKLWAMHAGASLDDLAPKDLLAHGGDELTLSEYFQSINVLAINRYKYGFYKKAFRYSFQNDPKNPMACTLVECDQHLTAHPSIKRTPLVNLNEKVEAKLLNDTFSMAMQILNNERHSN